MAKGPSLKDRRHFWLLVPALSWGGVLAGILLPFSPPYLPFGSFGCVLASLAIAAMALTRQRKDIVSICVPIFAVIIFVFPLETKPTLVLEVLYAATLTALVIRLEKRFPA